MLLEPRTLERLDRLSLQVRERLAGSNPGEHRSLRTGSSVDFADWRPYVEGDDFRRIDFGIYARLDRLVVRLYEAEEELNLRIVVDASASMGFERKLETALRLAGAIAYLGGAHHDRARVWVADGSGIRPSPWARSRQGALHVHRWMEAVEAGGASNLAEALRRLASSGGLPGLTIVISDLLFPEWETVVRRLGGPGAEGALLQVLARSELEPSLRGDLLLVDSESDELVEVSMSDQVLKEYRARAVRFVAGVAEACRSRGIRYSRVSPDDDLEALLLTELRTQGLVR
ncbi:MAG TPA: DUF58 domain-containing protein [Actinomycetota bacterium]|nr:DUF58 domain-containing protein [Actinomycetota bacterium]